MKNSLPGIPLCLLIFAVFGGPVRAADTGEYSDGKAAASVLGQHNLTDSAPNQGVAASDATVNDPSAVAVDPATGKVFVADSLNNRILRFASAEALQNGAGAEAVLGQADFAGTGADTARSRMNNPRDVAVDNAGRLWVADSGNNRVLRFDGGATKLSGANADGVLGQVDFFSSGAATSEPGMSNPSFLEIDANGRLWVSDHDNHRVLRFDDAANKLNGANADGVLGQTDFVSSAAATSQIGMDQPNGVAVDPGGRLWVSDEGNHRVLRFDAAAGKTDGDVADAVLGQVNFTTNTQNTSASELDGPNGLAIDSEGRLWVADSGNQRLLRFDSAAGKGDGSNADGVLGSTDFDVAGGGISAELFGFPADIGVDGANRIWVADRGNHRVLRFQTDHYQPDGIIWTKAARKKGDDIYNGNGARQTVTIKVKGTRPGKAKFAVENDGDMPDSYTVRGTRGNKNLDVAYFRKPGGNVTAEIIKGGYALNQVPARGKAKFSVTVTGGSKAKGKSGGRNLTIRAISLFDGETDVLKAKAKRTP